MEVKTVNSDLEKRVEDALNTVRPYLEADGGDLKVLEITDEMVVRIELLGSCGSCPMSTMTMKAGIEQAVKSAVPEIVSVEAINITAFDNPRAKMPNV
ncbi:MAG: Fe-S cluster biogenesis protein NfuA [Flammeovirgaceae bacterium]|jgi:Fe-S cluster biogenesis protein NfuA